MPVKQKYDMRVSPENRDNTIREYLSEIDSAISLSCWLLYKYREHQQLADKLPNPSNYLDPVSFGRDYRACSFLRKSSFLSLPNPKQRAISSFYESEEACLETNKTLQNRLSSGNRTASYICYVAREKIQSLLGELDSTVINSIIDNCGFGPGSTTTVKGMWSGPSNKMDSMTEVTRGLHNLLLASLSTTDYPQWPAMFNRTVTLGNKLCTVPKNAKTDRVIAIEPTLNAFFQRGVGVVLRNKLKKWGLDLTDQGRSKKLARLGSQTNHLATIDFKAASDTISWETVNFLLPKKWFTLLAALRSPYYEFENTWKRYNKFSSMGNGYTFELETLIFSSIVQAVRSVMNDHSQWCVYGDDVILSSRCAPTFIECSSIFGFSVNEDKTFINSPFRESCGGHYFLGEDVTPFYAKDLGVSNTIALHNYSFKNNMMRTCVSIRSSLPRRYRVFGPPGVEVTTLWISSYEWVDRYLLRRRPYGPVIGYRFRYLKFIPRSQKLPDTLGGIGESLLRLELLQPHLPHDPHLQSARRAGRWVLSYMVWPSWPDFYNKEE